MIDYIETHIVEHCNLKCRGCSHFSGLAPISFKDIDEYKSEMKELASVEEIGTIRIMGGEPLLHPKWFEFCKVTRELFPKASVILVTNGILLSNIEQYIDAMNLYGIGLCISDYHIKINEDILLKLNNVVKHEKGRLYNIGLDLSGSQNINYSFAKCDLAQNKWYFFKNGRLYTCCIMANIDYFNNKFDNKIKYDLDDVSIRVAGNMAWEIEQFLNSPHDACKYCDTYFREHSYSNFATTKGDVKEWTCQ